MCMTFSCLILLSPSPSLSAWVSLLPPPRLLPQFLLLSSLPHTMLPLLSVERAACMPNQVIHKYRTNVCHYRFTTMTKAWPFCLWKVCPFVMWDHSPHSLLTLYLSLTDRSILPTHIRLGVWMIYCGGLSKAETKSAFPFNPPPHLQHSSKAIFWSLGLNCKYLFWLKSARGSLLKMR